MPAIVKVLHIDHDSVEHRQNGHVISGHGGNDMVRRRRLANADFFELYTRVSRDSIDSGSRPVALSSIHDRRIIERL